MQHYNVCGIHEKPFHDSVVLILANWFNSTNPDRMRIDRDRTSPRGEALPHHRMYGSQ